ncbi:site-specific DNA-methyltransferase [Leptolyngbya sp. DQ-M1]|uniref:DNA methyltransferase n=1 Tax=Leptolyngbya sp. DQ-M1 TaxID=2933920 RepID=UPI0032979919
MPNAEVESPRSTQLSLPIPVPNSNRKGLEINQLRPEDRSAHDWYRFVLSYPPHLVREYLQKFKIDSSQRVLDPFCGTGTTPVECKKLGIKSVGIEANAMAAFACQTKLNWTVDPDALIRHAEDIATTAEAVQNQPRQPRTLTEEVQKLLLADSISPVPLDKTLVLLEEIQRHSNDRYDAHIRLALAKALVFSISNLRFRPEVSIGVAKSDAPVIESWLQAVRIIANDLRTLASQAETEAIVHHADSRNAGQILAPDSIDAVITSPPYPNEKDYTRTTRLESVLLGFINTKAELQAMKRGLVRSNTRGVYKVDDDDRWVSHFPEIQRIAQEIEDRRIELGKTSGFERMYARVTKLYFGGMAKHLAELRSALRPGAQLAYVVGDQASYLRVMIRTGQLLADIASELGYEVVNIDLFRTRLATATKEQIREEVVVLRWNGKQ